MAPFSCPRCEVSRLVRTDIATAGPPEAWEDLIGEHEKDLLQWASAHEVLPPPLCSNSAPLHSTG